MARYEVTDRYTTYTVEAATREAAVLAYADRTGLIAGSDYEDAEDLEKQNELFIEEVE